MKDFVADTHAVIWYLARDKRLSRRAHTAFLKAKSGYGHVISCYSILQIGGNGLVALGL